MKNVFELLSDITYSKEEYLLKPEDEFTPYMIQRWLSFMSPEHCYLLNEVFNNRYGAFDNQMMMDVLKVILPKQRFTNKYIKKPAKNKAAKPKDDDTVDLLSKSMQIGKDEVKDILETFPELVEVYKEKSRMMKKT